jgi:hypothetical protein
MPYRPIRLTENKTLIVEGGPHHQPGFLLLGLVPLEQLQHEGGEE